MEVAEQTEKGLEELGPVLGQPTIQIREKMKVSKRRAAKEDLTSNYLGGHKRAEEGGPGTETLNVDIVTPASRFLRSKAGGTQQTSRRGRGRGRGKTQVNLVDSRTTPLTTTEDGTSEDSGADIGASMDGILQITVRCRLLAMLSRFRSVHNERLRSDPRPPFGLGLLFL